MNNDKLYDEVKTLYNTSDSAFGVYDTLKLIESKNNESNLIIILHSTRQEAEKHFKRGKQILGEKAKYNLSRLEIECEDKIMKFTTLNNIDRLRGIKAKEIRFWN